MKTALLSLFLLLGLLAWYGAWFPEYSRAEPPPVARAVESARKAGVDEDCLNRILAVSSEKGFDDQAATELVDLLQVVAVEGFPCSRFVAKIEEGALKGISTDRLVAALSRKLEEYRFVQQLIADRLRPRPGVFGPGHLETMAETLDMGLGRESLRAYMEGAPRVPPAMLAQGAESLVLLRQAGLSTEGAWAIVCTGLDRAAFTSGWRILPLLASKAGRRGMPEGEIVAIVTRILGRDGDMREVADELGVTWRDLQRGP